MYSLVAILFIFVLVTILSVVIGVAIFLSRRQKTPVNPNIIDVQARDSSSANNSDSQD